MFLSIDKPKTLFSNILSKWPLSFDEGIEHKVNQGTDFVYLYRFLEFVCLLIISNYICLYLIVNINVQNFDLHIFCIKSRCHRL